MQVGMKLKDFAGYLSDITRQFQSNISARGGGKPAASIHIATEPGEALPPHFLRFSSAHGDRIGL
jgi:hypothetical protein